MHPGHLVHPACRQQVQHSYFALPGLWVHGVVETGLGAQAKDLLQEELCVVPEGGVQGQVVQTPVLVPLVVVEVDEVFDVVVGAYVLDVLQRRKGTGDQLQACHDKHPGK